MDARRRLLLHFPRARVRIRRRRLRDVEHARIYPWSPSQRRIRTRTFRGRHGRAPTRLRRLLPRWIDPCQAERLERLVLRARRDHDCRIRRSRRRLFAVPGRRRRAARYCLPHGRASHRRRRRPAVPRRSPATPAAHADSNPGASAAYGGREHARGPSPSSGRTGQRGGGHPDRYGRPAGRDAARARSRLSGPLQRTLRSDSGAGATNLGGERPTTTTRSGKSTIVGDPNRRDPLLPHVLVSPRE